MATAMETAGADRVRKQVISKRLMCSLNERELREYGAKLADACEDIVNEESAQSEIKSQLKAKLTSLEARRAELATVVRRKADYRDVPVEIYYDYARAVVEEVRTDTGETIVTRAMTDTERQMRLIADEGDEGDGE
jgi:hypothetical protein